MKEALKTLDGLPWIVKLLLTILYGFYGNILRLMRSIAKEDAVGIILAIILLCAGGLGVLWIWDIFCVATKRDIWWID